MDDPTILPPPKYTKERADFIYGEAFRRAMEFVVYQNIPGDVIEFGTLNGYTARKLAELMVELGHPGKLWLFDSFEGMPEATHSIDRSSYEILAGAWRPGTPTARIEGVENLIRDALTPLLGDRLRIVKGWYKDTRAEVPRGPVSIAHIDCDFYESAKDALDGLVLQTGTILLMDDYNSSRASDHFGERRVLRPLLLSGVVEPWFSYGWHAQAFICH